MANSSLQSVNFASPSSKIEPSRGLLAVKEQKVHAIKVHLTSCCDLPHGTQSVSKYSELVSESGNCSSQGISLSRKFQSFRKATEQQVETTERPWCRTNRHRSLGRWYISVWREQEPTRATSFEIVLVD